ncbi:MAG: Hint domain-containing protein [Rhodospirillales bacterium]|nr:Hint domain-containing protein [Rhodospirillales bacterium]
MSWLLRVAADCKLATPGGMRPALTLEPGDAIAIGPGIERRVRQASRIVIARQTPRRTLWPVSVPAGSLGADLPSTDLVVAVEQILPLADGLGAPARFLVDGVAIRHAPGPERLDVVELELDAPLATLAPETTLPHLVEAVAARHLPPAGPPTGAIDEAGNEGASGWARDAVRPGQPLLLTLEIDGIARALLLADLYRDDLAAAMAGEGRHGFRLAFTPALARRDYHHVALCRAWDRAPVAGAEMLISAAPPLGLAMATVAALAPEARAQALSAALMALGEAARA